MKTVPNLNEDDARNAHVEVVPQLFVLRLISDAFDLFDPVVDILAFGESGVEGLHGLIEQVEDLLDAPLLFALLTGDEKASDSGLQLVVLPTRRQLLFVPGLLVSFLVHI